jgi:ubiquinone/menaquinone biosynthesis C-methylase UbiE
MKEYWDSIAGRDDVNWHIAHIEDEQEFFLSGERSARSLFGARLEHLPHKGRVLEIGCGKGRITRHLAMARPKVFFFGVDVSKQMVIQAWHAAPKSLPINLCYLVGDGVSLGMFPDAFFDLVYSYIVFQHLPRHIVRGYVSEARRVLNPEGRLIFQVQTRAGRQDKEPPDQDFRTIRYYTVDEARELAGTCFKITETRGVENGHDFFVHAMK